MRKPILKHNMSQCAACGSWVSLSEAARAKEATAGQETIALLRDELEVLKHKLKEATTPAATKPTLKPKSS
jgi:hypothetical protein